MRRTTRKSGVGRDGGADEDVVRLVRRALLVGSWLVPVVLAAAAIFELALVLSSAGAGPASGEGPAGSNQVTAIGAAAMLAAFLGSVGHLVKPSRRSGLTVAAPAAAAFVAALLFTDDPYYAPGRLEYARNVPHWWIVTMIAVSLCAAYLSRKIPRLGAAATAIVLLAIWVTWIGAASH